VACGASSLVSATIILSLKRAIIEVLSEAYWQRCYVHLLRNALDYLPRKVADDCLIELRCLLRSAQCGGGPRGSRGLAAALARKYPRLCGWVEEKIEETLTVYRLPREHHKHLKSTNMLEPLNQDIERRTHVIRIFPKEESALRLIRALAVALYEDWIEAHRYLNMEMLRRTAQTTSTAGGRLKNARRLFSDRWL
jgi:putative transposase